MNKPTLLLLMALAWLAACGGSNGSIGGGPFCAIGMTPATKTVAVGNTLSLSVSGGSAPLSYSVSGSGGTVSSSGVFTATSSSGTATVTVTDLYGCTASSQITMHAASARIIVGASLSAGTGQICTSTFNYSDNSLTAFSCIAGSGDTFMRGTGLRNTQTISAGATGTTLYFNNVGSAAPSSGGTLALSGVPGGFDLAHGICTVPRASDPNGYVYLIGDYNGGATQPITGEFSSTGGYTRTAFTSALFNGGASAGSLSYCHAASESKVYALDASPNSTNDGMLLELAFNGSSWSTVRSSPAFLSGFSGGSMGVWSMVIHEDGYIYLPPLNPAAGTNKKMVRCPQSDVSSCAVVSGSDAPSAGGMFIGAVQLPGLNDILITTMGRNIYRYSYADGTYTFVKAVAGADITNISQLRAIYAE